MERPSGEVRGGQPQRRNLVTIADRGGDAADVPLAFQLGEGAADRPVRPAETRREGAVARRRLRRLGSLLQRREDLVLDAVASAADGHVSLQLSLRVCLLLALERRGAI